MKPHLRLLLGLWMALCTGLSGAVAPAPLTSKEILQGYREHRILVRPKAGRILESGDAEARAGVRVRREFKRFRNARVVELDATDSADAAIVRLRATGRYDAVERDLLRYALVVPNDTSFAQQWGLRNTGQSSGTAGADIAATSGWDTRTDASGVIVAILDTGARLTHSDLAANLWTSNGVHGINAILAKSSASYTNPTDDNGHGTHVTGIIGAVANNATGVSGVAWRTQLMPLKFIPSDGSGSVSDELECIQYAIDHGARIINASFGSSGSSGIELDAIRSARDAGIIFVAAAGNGRDDDGVAINNDTNATFPTNYLVDNVVSVAALTRTNVLGTFSNYGGSVDLAAPGSEIYSTYNGSDTSYSTLSGTSMAAPHVSGTLALLWAQFPNDSYRQIINRLLRSVTRVPALDGKVQTGGRLNLARALTSTSNRPFNDDFADRASLSGANIRARASNVGATLENGEPTHAGTTGGASVWWSWTAPETTQVAFDTSGSLTPADATLDTTLALYTGDGVSTLQAVASNDDATTDNATSRVQLDVTAGTTYHVAVDSKGTTRGMIVLRVGAVPANDAFANARVLTGESASISATLLNASRESGEPLPAGNTASHSVWYRWTAPSSGHYVLSAFATQIDTVAAVFTGSSLGSLTTVAWNNNSSNSNSDALVPFDATAGTTYYFQVDHALGDGSAGEFTLTLTQAAWEYPAMDEITSSPAVAPDGTIYFGTGSDDGKDTQVYAVTADGATRWKFRVGATGIVGASPAIGADGTVYLGAMDKTFYALNGSDGTRKWSYTAGSEIYSVPAVATDGTVYFRDDTKLYALTSAGALKWSFTLAAGSAGTYSSPVIAPDGTIYVGNNEGAFFALKPDGTQKWKFTANEDVTNPGDSDIYTTPALAADGTIYFANLHGTVYALTDSGTSATKKWSWTTADRSSITSSIALGPDGTLYFAGYDHKLHALSSAGSEKWTYPLGNEVRASSPAVAADGTVYVGCYDGLVYAVNADGSLRRTYATARMIRSSPVLANNRLYIGSNDAKLYALDLGQGAASSNWPMFHQNAQRTGRKPPSGGGIALQPQSTTAASGGAATLSVSPDGSGPFTYQWYQAGRAVAGATGATLTLSNLQPAQAGLYTVTVTGGSSVTSQPAAVGLTITSKFVGAATEVGSDITLPTTGRTYDQLLLQGPAVSLRADPGQVTRVSYVDDPSDDIVQVEFSGAGTLTLVLEGATGPAAPAKYNQPGAAYMKGHGHIVVAGADDTTNVTVFSVGTVTALNQSLFRSDVTYDGVADIASVSVLSTNGQFGGIRTANASYIAASGWTGVYAPGVRFVGPVYVGDIAASDRATPMLLLGQADPTQINGGDLLQPNGAAVQVSGVTRLAFVAGTTSHGIRLPAQANRARLEQNGADVTTQIVVNPTP